VITLIVAVIGPLDRRGKPRLNFLIILAALLAVPIIYRAIHLDLHVYPVIVGMVVAVLVAEGVVWLVARGPAGARTVCWLVFAVVVGLSGVFAYLRAEDRPQLEPVAVLRAGDKQGLSGFMIGETPESIYLAPLSPLDRTGIEVSPDREPDDIMEVPRKQLVAWRVAPPAGLGETDDGPERARELLEQLVREEDAAANESPPVITTEDPAVTFAPLVHVDSADPTNPTSVHYFFENSWLMWAHDGKCPDYSVTLDRELAHPEQSRDQIMGRFDPARLAGKNAYTHVPANADCDDSGATYSATQHTRPSDGSRPEGLDPYEGFYLDLWDPKRHGEGDAHVDDGGGQALLKDVPVYYEKQTIPKGNDTPPTTLRITYWFFYPLSVPPGTSPVGDAFVHEGDWERIAVTLRIAGKDQYVPAAVRYYIHDEYLDRAWSNVEMTSSGGEAATHPVVYSGSGSHASYPTNGDFKISFKLGGVAATEVTDRARSCSDCPEWRTWEDLVKAREQSWYGYGGAWGEVRPADRGGTGPLGPSPYKLQALESLPGVLGTDPGESGEIEHVKEPPAG
jgi:hypothetical protein